MYIYNINWWNQELPKGVKSGIPEIVGISCPTCGTRHDLPKITGHQSYVTVGEQTLQPFNVCVHFVNRVYMTTIEFPKQVI